MTAVQTEPACHEHARDLLRRFNVYAKDIIRVDGDSIVFANHSGQVRTAWLGIAKDGKSPLVLDTEPGMPAWPS